MENKPNAAENDLNILREVREFLNNINHSDAPPLETLPVEDARKVLEDVQKAVEFNYDDIEETEQFIVQDGYRMNIHLVRPKGKKGVLPVFMFFHGGGWVLGDYTTHKRLVRDLVVGSGAVAVFPDYTPSPEARYPEAIHQAYAATQWVYENAAELEVDAQSLALVGNSVGGNMATVVALMAKEKGGPKIVQQVLLWPVIDADFSRKSYQKYGEGRFLTTQMMEWMWANYLPDEQARKDKYATPVNASLQELKGLPPTLIQLAENDILFDEGLAYGRKLNEAGVDTTLVEYKGLIHDYGLLNSLNNIESVRNAIADAAQYLKRGYLR